VRIVLLARDDRKLRGSLGFRYAGFEAADGPKFVIVQRLHQFRRFFVVERRPKLRSLIWISEPGRHDADDGIRLGVEVNCLIEDGRITAKAPLPQSPAQDGRAIRRRLIVCRSERASQHWLDAKQRKQIPRTLPGMHFFGKLSARSRQAVFRGVGPHDCQIREAMAPLFPFGEHAASNHVIREFVIHAPLIQADQPLGVVKRQRCEEYGTDDSE